MKQAVQWGRRPEMLFLATYCTRILALVAASLCMAGCVGTSPLTASAGWKEVFSGIEKLSQVLVEDYQAYIHELPAEQRRQVTESSIHFMKNADGRHAVYFVTSRPPFIGISDSHYTHVLIYDSSHKRSKVVKYKSGESLSGF